MTFIRAVIGFSFIIIVCAFAVMNRQDVGVSWSPLHDPYDIPLYAVMLGALASGFIAGAILVWVNGVGVRVERRRQKKKIKTLEKELTTAQAVQKAEATIPHSDFFPSLPDRRQKSDRA